MIECSYQLCLTPWLNLIFFFVCHRKHHRLQPLSLLSRNNSVWITPIIFVFFFLCGQISTNDRCNCSLYVLCSNFRYPQFSLHNNLFFGCFFFVGYLHGFQKKNVIYRICLWRWPTEIFDRANLSFDIFLIVLFVFLFI